MSMLLISALFGIPIIQFIESYVYNDWGFLQTLLVLICVDTLTGFVKYWKLNQISSTGFGKLLFKLLTYSSVLIITHTMTEFKIRGEVNQFFGWFDDLAYSAIMIREAISILENLGASKNKFIPKSILKKLIEFDKDGEYVKKNQDADN